MENTLSIFQKQIIDINTNPPLIIYIQFLDDIEHLNLA